MNRLPPEQRFQIVQFISKIMVDFHKRIFFSDEAHFWLNGYVNKQNCRICVKLIHKCMSKHRYIQKTDCLCALWAGGIIGPYFFKTMKATTLQSMVIGIEPRLLTFHSELNNHDVQSCGSNKTAQHVPQLVPQSIY
ncbi:hypothetical protein TNCV_1569231 [Trichonephila clavipes]|nr:hypothetical protein TNCV_1569231 [Trichonephila clavipes]